MCCVIIWSFLLFTKQRKTFCVLQGRSKLLLPKQVPLSLLPSNSCVLSTHWTFVQQQRCCRLKSGVKRVRFQLEEEQNTTTATTRNNDWKPGWWQQALVGCVTCKMDETICELESPSTEAACCQSIVVGSPRMPLHTRIQLVRGGCSAIGGLASNPDTPSGIWDAVISSVTASAWGRRG